MIFYTALDSQGHRQLRGTQADAKAVNKNFEQVDIPTDKAGLMAFVQKLYDDIYDLEREALTDDDAPTNRGGVEEAGFIPEPSYIQQSIDLDTQFEELPLARQLHFAAVAMENARERISS